MSFISLNWPGATEKVNYSWQTQPVLYLTLTTLPPLVNQVDGEQHYCWSKHFSRTFISFLFSFIALSMELYESNIFPWLFVWA